MLRIDCKLYMHFAYEHMTHAPSKFELKWGQPAWTTYNTED
jgi:hypothetical protein